MEQQVKRREAVPGFGRRLRELRDARDMTQAQLAAAAGVTQGMVANVEAGRGSPSLAVALQLARALGVTVNHLLPDQVVTAEGRKALRARPR